MYCTPFWQCFDKQHNRCSCRTSVLTQYVWYQEVEYNCVITYPHGEDMCFSSFYIFPLALVLSPVINHRTFKNENFNLEPPSTNSLPCPRGLLKVSPSYVGRNELPTTHCSLLASLTIVHCRINEISTDNSSEVLTQGLWNSETCHTLNSYEDHFDRYGRTYRNGIFVTKFMVS